MKDSTAAKLGKPYAAPQVVEYGHIEKLTKGTSNAGADHNGKKTS